MNSLRDAFNDDEADEDEDAEPDLRDYIEHNPEDVDHPLPKYVDMEDGDGPFPPPLRDLPEIPDEIGFHVSVDVHSHSNTPTLESDPARRLSTDKTQLHFDRHEAEKRAMEDEAMGYLTRATYHQNYHEMDAMSYDQGMFDASKSQETTEFVHHDDDSHQPGGRPRLETAISFAEMETIEGEIIDQVDYENVTLVRTKIERSRMSSSVRDISYSSSTDHDQDYLNMDAEGNQIWDDRVPPTGVHKTGGLQPPGGKPETLSVKSAVSYENFDPVTKYVPKSGLGVNQNVHPADLGVDYNAHDDPSQLRVTVSEQFITGEGDAERNPAHDMVAGEEDLYMNVPSLSQRAAAVSSGAAAGGGGGEGEMTYENIAPRMYKQGCV